MPDIIYNQFQGAIASGVIDWENDNLRAALVSGNIYDPDKDDDYWSDVSQYEIHNGNGYTISGYLVTGSLSVQDGSDNVKYDITDPTWTASGDSIIASGCVLYDQSTIEEHLIYYFDFTEDKEAADGADFTIVVDSNGLFTSAQA
jgi:hypothetical protein